jgi:hypothetical protein
MVAGVQLVEAEEMPSDNVDTIPLPEIETLLAVLESVTIPQPVAVRCEAPFTVRFVPDVPARHTQVELNLLLPAVAVAETVCVANLDENAPIKNV